MSADDAKPTSGEPPSSGKVEPAQKRHGELGTPLLTCFSLGIMISGVTIGWSRSGEDGFGYVMLLLSGMTIGYMALTSCLGEMISMFPFSGGIFGYIRCSLGPYMGFMVGCLEATQNLLFLTAMVNAISDATIESLTREQDRQNLVDYEVFVWAGTLLIPCSIQCYGGSAFWRFTIATTGVSLLLIAIYIFGSMSSADYEKHAVENDLGPSQVAVSSGTMELLRHLHDMMWIYKGAEMPALLCEEAKDVASIPKAMMISMGIMIVLAYACATLAFSNAPGTFGVAELDFPLGPGYDKIFNVDRIGFLFSLPLLATSAQAFLYAFAKQVHAMALSGLAPPIFSKLYGPNQTPVFAICVGSAFVLALLLITHINVFLESRLLDLYESAIVILCLVQIFLFYAYYTFVTRFSNVQRKFSVPSALSFPTMIMGAGIFSVAAGGLIAWDIDRKGYICVILSALIFIWSVYYKLVVEPRQFFSPEEQKIFLKAYIVNTHVHKKNKQQMAKLMKTILFFIKFEEISKTPKTKHAAAAAHSAEEKKKLKQERKKEKINNLMSPTLVKMTAHNQISNRELLEGMSLEMSMDSSCESKSECSSHDDESEHDSLIAGVSPGILGNKDDNASDESGSVGSNKSTMSSSSIQLRNNKVLPDDPIAQAARDTVRANEEIERALRATSTAPSPSIAVATPDQKKISGSKKITWSGKSISESESKRLFGLISTSGKNGARFVQKEMIEQFPELFSVVDANEASARFLEDELCVSISITANQTDGTSAGLTSTSISSAPAEEGAAVELVRGAEIV